MTNLVVWRRTTPLGASVLTPPSGAPPFEDRAPQIWVAADARVTDPSRISDQATKILPLMATTHKHIPGHGYQGYWTLKMGFAFAGAVFPALMTHAALKVLLANLGPGRAPLPTLGQVAKLAVKLVERYVREAVRAFREVPHCQIVLVGMSEFEGEQAAYLVGAEPYHPDFKYGVRRLSLDDVHVFGDKTGPLKDEIAQLMASNDPRLHGLEPRVALAARIEAGEHPSVGGSVQYGVLAGGGFTVYALTDDVNRTFLGFGLQELGDDLGFQILLDAVK